MDIAMVIGGIVIAFSQALDPEQVESVIGVLDNLASREACTPGERDIFRGAANALAGRDCEVVNHPRRPKLQLITGGAA
jgi:hypothetical protein